MTERERELANKDENTLKKKKKKDNSGSKIGCWLEDWKWQQQIEYRKRSRPVWCYDMDHTEKFQWTWKK